MGTTIKASFKHSMRTTSIVSIYIVFLCLLFLSATYGRIQQEDIIIATPSLITACGILTILLCILFAACKETRPAIFMADCIVCVYSYWLAYIDQGLPLVKMITPVYGTIIAVIITGAFLSLINVTVTDLMLRDCIND